MTEGSSRLLMLRLAVDYNRIIRRRQLRRTVPNFFNERTRRIVLFDIHANFPQFLLQLQRGSKSWNQHDIVSSKLRKRGDGPAFCVLQKPNTLILQVLIDLWIVNHLAQQENSFTLILLHGLVGDFDGIFNAKTKSKMPRQNNAYTAKIQHTRLKVLFSRIPRLAPLLYAGNNGGMIKVGNFERAHVIQNLNVNLTSRCERNGSQMLKYPSKPKLLEAMTRKWRYESTAFKILGVGHFDVRGFCHDDCGSLSLR